MLPSFKSFSVKETPKVNYEFSDNDNKLSNNSESTKNMSFIDKKDFIQDITPITYNVDFKSLSGGEAFDFNDINYNQISENNIFRKNNSEIIILISTDGSIQSEYAAKFVTKEFIANINNKNTIETNDILKSNNLSKITNNNEITAKFLAVYVYFSSKNKDFNYSNAKDNVIAKFGEIYGYYKKLGIFYIEDRWSKRHHLQQESIHAKNNKVDFHFIGYNGIKGPKGDSSELNKGIDFLLSSSITPFVIIKEYAERNNNLNSFKDNNTNNSYINRLNNSNQNNGNNSKIAEMFNDKKRKGFNWLFILDNNNLGRIRLLEKFTSLIDADNDIVYGFGLFEGSVPNSDRVKNEFEEYCEKKKFNYYCYDSVTFKNTIADLINDKVNYGSENFNFVCLFNSVSKYLKDGKDSDYISIINKCNSNICIVNY